MGDNDTLTTNQRRALNALLDSTSVRAAAKKANLGETTLWRYLSDATFKTALSKRQDAIVSSVTAALTGMAGESVKTLRGILRSRTASDAVKCRAALGWLSQMRQSVELADLSERVRALEQEQGGVKT